MRSTFGDLQAIQASHLPLMHLQSNSVRSTDLATLILGMLFLAYSALSAIGKDAPIEGDPRILNYGNVYWNSVDDASMGYSGWEPKQVSATISDTFKPNSKYKAFKHWVRAVETDEFDRKVVYVTSRGRWDTLTTPGYDYLKWRIVISTTGKPKIEEGWDKAFKAPFKAVPED